MADKVIHELRIIETDDGFRIEIKGDKERLREMVGAWRHFGQGHMGHGPWGGHRGHHGPRGFGFPFGRHHGYGPWSWWTEEEEEEGGKRKPEEASQV